MKEEIRERMKGLRGQMSSQEKDDKNEAIRNLLLNSELYQKCSFLFTYVSFSNEADTIAIINQAFKDQKKVYIPKVDGKDMEFYEIAGLDHLVKSYYGAMEPPTEEEKRYKPLQEIDECPLLTIEGNKLMLVPGLAFDSKGNRIGFGAGYYDRYLAKYRKEGFFKTALAYEFQVVDQIEADEYDIPMDAIVTPDGIRMVSMI